MVVRPIDGNELVNTLKQIVSDYTSHGMYPSAFPVEYAIEIVEKMPTLTQPNEPLTLEQLREMDGKPVWIERNESPHDGKWFIVDHADIENPDRTLYTKEGVTYSDYGVHFTAYAYPPAHIDREAWEKPCSMCGGKTTLYQHTNTTKLFMNTFGNAATLVTECMACPPYADCCMKGISANSAFKINFCPECGRPLTEKARAEREKRMGV